jgi:hypothetical protein
MMFVLTLHSFWKQFCQPRPLRIGSQNRGYVTKRHLKGYLRTGNFFEKRLWQCKNELSDAVGMQPRPDRPDEKRR